MFLAHENESITSKEICLSYRVTIFLGAFEILYNVQVSDYRDHMTISVMTLHMLTTDSNLFVSIFNCKSVSGSQGRFCAPMSLIGGMDGARNH